VDLSSLSDEKLFGRVEALARTERVTLVDFLIHLGELDARPACQNKGYSSAFAYLTRHLGYSESDAIRRVRASRAARDYPSILRMLAEGELHLVGVAMLQPLLTSANHESLLRKAARRSTREIERLAADISPAGAGPRDRIRALPLPSRPCEPAAAENAAAGNGFALLPELEIAAAPEAKALGVERRVLFTFTANEEVRGLFEQARDLLRHRFPMGGMDEIIGEALRRLVAQERPGLGSAPRRKNAPRNESNRRRIPKRVEDEVWRRDGGRCAFSGSGGVRCGETAWLELDHVAPFALGGRSDEPANVRLLCRAHNQSEARRIFG